MLSTDPIRNAARFAAAALLATSLAGLAAPTVAFAQAAGTGGGVSVAGVGHDKGAANARVFIVEFGDFGCSYCARFASETWPALDSIYIKTGRVRWKYVPFVTGMFRNAREAAEAAECAGEQGAFWQMHDLLYARRREWMDSKSPRALLGRFAAELKLDAATFARCSMSPATRQRIMRNDALANSLAIRGTPTFFVNGRVVPGAIPLDLFRQIIDEAGR